MPRHCSVRRFGGAVAVIAACGALSPLTPPVIVSAETSGADADWIVARLNATFAQERHLVGSFATSKTFTIVHDGRTSAQVVAALRFTAPDTMVFTVLESRGSEFMRTRVIDRMMAAEIDIARGAARARAALTSDNYRFGAVREDGDAYVVEVDPRRQDELLFKGHAWITKNGFHLERIEGQPARNPSFWTRRIRFVSEFVPVNGVWMQVRTEATVTMRALGEFGLRAECGPYTMSMTRDAAGQ